MKRNKFYIFLVILTIISLFSFAAICNQCAADTGDKEDVEEDEAEVDETVLEEDDDGSDTEDTDIDDEDDADEDDDSDTDDTDAEKEAPTLSLEVYEGPIYSAADDICYWRVKANLTGSPNPTISWSRDNSNGSFGNKKAQVNLSRGETYTLIATAANSEGSVARSITLEWGCDEPPAEDPADEDPPDEDPEPEETSISATSDISGEIWSTDEIFHYPLVFMGDDDANNYSKGYYSFDISGLHGKTVQDAEINFTSIMSTGHPETFASSIVVKVFNYVRLDTSDFEVGGTHLASIPISSASYTISGNNLKNELQAVLDNGARDYFQLKLGLNVATNNNNSEDTIGINCAHAILQISYTD